MEKKAYVKPAMESETFVPNTYVAACGDSGTVYKFKCDAGYILSSGGHVWQATNGEEGLQQSGSHSDTDLGFYHPCSETHEASKTDEFVEGYLTGYLLPFPKKVIIWKGKNNDNVHGTTNLDQSSWETAKS